MSAQISSNHLRCIHNAIIGRKSVDLHPTFSRPELAKQKMTQDRKRHIENLKKEVASKFGRTLETAADFDTLSMAIQQSISETVSPSTLKRVFGYVKYNAEPSATTLSILSRYVGYAGWSDFCRDFRPSEADGGTLHSRISKQKKLILFLAAASIILTIVCILLSTRLGSPMSAYRNAVPRGTGTVIHDTVLPGASPAMTQTEIDEAKYQEIRSECIMRVKHMTDSVMAMRNELPLYRYVEKCDSAYFRIAFDYMKPYINRRISETFPDNDTLSTIHNNALFIECRDLAMVLMTHLTAEERRQAYEDKFGQAK